MRILHGLLYTTAILLASISAITGFFVLFAEFAGSEIYTYTQGTVIQVVPNAQQGSIAQVRFTTKQHTTSEFQMANAFPSYRLGAKLPIRYKRDDPSQAYNASFAANGLLGIVLIWFSLLCMMLIGGPILFRRYIWRQVAISIRWQKRRI